MVKSIAQSISTPDIDALIDFLSSQYSVGNKPLFTFLSGSVAEGLSTPSSDYDVYAVYNECEEAEVLISDFERPIEITSIKLSKLVGILEFISAGEGLANISPYELLLCHRVHSGIGLTGQLSFHKLKSLLDPRTFTTRLSELCFMYAERSLKVCAGNLMVNDHASALLNANHAIRQTFNRLLVICGATSLLEKWQLAYAKKYLGQQHPAYEEFIRLMSSIPYGNEIESHCYLKRAFRFQQVVGDYVRFQAESFGEFDWDARLLRKVNNTNKMVLCKSAFSRVIGVQGKFYMVFSSAPILELPAAAANLWLLIDNTSSMVDLQKKAEDILKLPGQSFFEYLGAFSSVNSLAVDNFDFMNYKA